MKQKKRNPFEVTDDEYAILDNQFKRLCYTQAWELLRKNSKNNHTNDFEDVVQELKMYILIAGIYYKRQIYIEKSLLLISKHVKDGFLKQITSELEELWKNRKRHGANRQKFGPLQEKLLDKLLKKVVPKKERPSKRAPLKIDSRFENYCKAITWNCQKNMGKKITREKSVRFGQVSLSEFDYLSTVGSQLSEISGYEV